MKFSDLMLDIASGDSSINDVYIQEAMGKINVSSSIFDAAYLISELPGEDISFVQEAADANGLPTDKEGAVGVANEAVFRELDAFYDLTISTAKKVKETANKSLVGLRTVGKKLGVNGSSDYLNGFVKPLQDAFAKAYPKGIKLDDKSGFVKAKYATRMTETYCKGMANILGAYGVSLGDVFKDEIVEMVARIPSGMMHVRDNNATSSKYDLKDLKSQLSTGGKQLAFDKQVSRNIHYTDTIKADNLSAFAIALYTLIAVSDAIIKAGKQKKKAIGEVKRVVANCTNTKRVTSSCQDINDGVKEWSSNLNSLVTNITKVFYDSIYGLGGALGGKKA